MSTDEFQALWKAYEQKLQRSLRLNEELLEAVRSRKVRAAFRWQIVFKIVMIGLGMGWNIFIGVLLWHYRSEPFFVVAALMVLCCTGYAIGGYFVQVVLLMQMNMSESIVGVQRQLAQLEAIIVRTLRVPFLQLPAYFFFFISRRLAATAGATFWIIEGCATGVSIVATIWVYRHITVEGAGRKGWVKKMVDNEGGKTIARARGFIREIEAYREEEKIV